MAEIDLTELETIRRYSLVTRGRVAPLADVRAALRADLEALDALDTAEAPADADAEGETSPAPPPPEEDTAYEAPKPAKKAAKKPAKAAKKAAKKARGKPATKSGRKGSGRRRSG